MSEEKNNEESSNEFTSLLAKDDYYIPQVGDMVKGKVVAASNSEVRLDIDGILMGIVRGPEMYIEVEDYANLKPGDEVEAAVIDVENENGELELSFRQVGQEKAWNNLHQAAKDKSSVKVKIIDANKGGLIARYCQINGFLPVSQLSPENYPRVSGGDKGKILEKLKSFVGKEFEVSVVTLSEEEDKVIFSEKDIWNKQQKPSLDLYKPGMVVEGKISAITNFGVFVNFDDNMEGLIHISELAWKRVNSPAELFKVGDSVKAEIVNVNEGKIFLSVKKLQPDPWKADDFKYKVKIQVEGKIVKINPFGLFIKLDEEIHGLAHISHLGLAPRERINDFFEIGETHLFEVVSLNLDEHRLGLKIIRKGEEKKEEKVKEEKVKEEKKEKKEKKTKED
jgi:small subunit ribosomal protein S1